MPSITIFGWVAVLFAFGAVVAFVFYLVTQKRRFGLVAIVLLLASALTWYITK